jgi:hypothetical protein
VTPEATLLEAVRILDVSGDDEVPVVEEEGRGRVAGILDRRAILERVRLAGGEGGGDPLPRGARGPRMGG